MLKDLLKKKDDMDKARLKVAERFGALYYRTQREVLEKAFKLDNARKSVVAVGFARGHVDKETRDFSLNGWTVFGVSVDGPTHDNPYWGDYKVEEFVVETEDEARNTLQTLHDLLMMQATGHVV